MKTRNNPYFISATYLLLLFVSGCTPIRDKDRYPLCIGNNVAAMRIVEYGTLTAIEGAEVDLIVTDGLGSGNVIETLISDETGLVTWPCTWEVDGICAWKPELYYGFCGGGYAITMTWVADNIYELYPHAWVKVTVYDDEPLNPEYYIRVGAPYFNSSTDIHNLVNGEFRVLEAYGNLADSLYWTKKLQINDSLVYSEYVPIYCSGQDTLEYQIHY